MARTAHEKNTKLINCVRNKKMDEIILNRYYSGLICLMAARPNICSCGEEMWSQYIGHKHTVAEWHFKCLKCGEEHFG